MSPPPPLDTTLRPTVLWPAAWIRWLGRVLVFLGLGLPWLVIAWRTQQAVQTPVATGQGVALRPAMLLLPTGTFVMGSPTDEPGRETDETPRQVAITRPFAMAVTEVTQAQYERVMGSLPTTGVACRPPAEGPEFPVVCVTWLEAVAYCNRLSELEGLPPCYGPNGAWDDTTCLGYRLPTEAEWEYAARAGGTQRYAGTDAEDEVCRYANVLDQSAAPTGPRFTCNDGYATLAPVQQLQPNAWWLYDLTGNAAEWVWDAAAEERLVRGGSWQAFRGAARNAARAVLPPAQRAPDLGFRVVRSLAP